MDTDEDKSGSRERPPQETLDRSPPRQPKKSTFSKGFSWKKKGVQDAEDNRDRRDFRDRDEYVPKRFGGKDDRDRFADRNRDREDKARREDDLQRDRGVRPGKDANRDWRHHDRTDRGSPRENGDRRRDDKRRVNNEGRDKKDKPSAMPSTFIIVTVNDRLGTKAQIPCLPDDTVGNFKKLVAAQIGRQPHEIMLKRQGERPLKDHITLADYGVSNGVQLDLELDTGD